MRSGTPSNSASSGGKNANLSTDSGSTVPVGSLDYRWGLSREQVF